MESMSAILTISDLSVTFDDVQALRSVSLSLPEGESLAVIGPNGAGKSVFLRALLKMVPYRGSIAWGAGARLGYVPQKIDADRHLPINFRNLFEAKAAVQNLSRKDIEEIKTTVGLDERILETPVGHLSGGQFQRALIAFALLGKPNVLILDEPTASIDKSGEEQVYELIHRLQDRFGMTVILVSHDLSFVYRYATRVLCINREEISYGTPEEALTPEALEKLYGPHKYFHHFVHSHEDNFKGGEGRRHDHAPDNDHPHAD
ncbi:MAG: metal ABC transporter ATP-binding protein [Candidatus Pacebacteria bacterium]|nr:metal ABC transporter ATP-binding protein [Candidatus Paceibacterota bacterium]